MRFTSFITCCVLFVTPLPAQTFLHYAVDFTVTDISGNTHNLFDYLDDGKHVMLNFFYSTCSPCISAVEPLNLAFEEYGCNQEDLISLAIDFNETDSLVMVFHDTYQCLIPTVSGLEGGGNSVVFSYLIYAFPTVILIRPDRKIINQDIYPVTTQNIDSAIQNQAGLSPVPTKCLFPTSTQSPSTPISKAWELYPNPAEGEVWLKSPQLTGNTPYLFDLYTLQGQLLKTWKQAPRLQSGNFQLSLQGLPPSYYLLIVRNASGVVARLPFVAL